MIKDHGSKSIKIMLNKDGSATILGEVTPKGKTEIGDKATKIINKAIKSQKPLSPNGLKALLAVTKDGDFKNRLKATSSVKNPKAVSPLSGKKNEMFGQLVNLLFGKQEPPPPSVSERMKLMGEETAPVSFDKQIRTAQATTPQIDKKQAAAKVMEIANKQGNKYVQRRKATKPTTAIQANLAESLTAQQKAVIDSIQQLKQSIGISTDVPATTRSLFVGQPVTERLYHLISQGVMSPQTKQKAVKAALGDSLMILAENEEMLKDAEKFGIDMAQPTEKVYEQIKQKKADGAYQELLDTFNKGDTGGDGKSLTDDEKVAIAAYTSMMFKHMNGLLSYVGSRAEGALRPDGNPQEAAEVIREIHNDEQLRNMAVITQAAMDAMAKLPKYRGTVDRITTLPKSATPLLKKGAEFFYSGFTSSSDTTKSKLFDEYDPASFTDDPSTKDAFHMAFGVENGVKIGHLGVNAGGPPEFHHEVLIPPGTIVRIDQTMTGGVTPHQIPGFDKVRKVAGRQISHGTTPADSSSQRAKTERPKTTNAPDLDKLIEVLPENMRKAARFALDVKKLLD